MTKKKSRLVSPVPQPRIAQLGPITNLRRYDGCPNYWLGDLTIEQTSFHVECIEVDPDADGTLAVHEAYQSRIDAVAGFDEGHVYRTVQIKGKPHFILIYPYQE